MTIGKFLEAFEREVPLGAAVGSDPVGLQIGDPRRELRGIAIVHDLDLRAIAFAKKRDANLLIVYHPVIFSPLQRVDLRDATAQIVSALLAENIFAFVVHTAFDSHPVGTNFLLARKLGLHDIAPLVPLENQSRKISVFVPVKNVDDVATAMWDAGAGNIGNYEHCSFRTEGVGTFCGGEFSNPTTGKKKNDELVKEIRLEMTCPQYHLGAVIAAMKATHPYEEVAFDVVALQNNIAGAGMGAAGNFSKPESLQKFCDRVKRVCGAAHVRTNGKLNKKIQRVALIGGSGGSFLHDAMRSGADVFLTGDVRYHSFREAEGRIILVDAGHRETERCVVDGLFTAVQKVLRSIKLSHIRTVRVLRNNFILHV